MSHPLVFSSPSSPSPSVLELSCVSPLHFQSESQGASRQQDVTAPSPPTAPALQQGHVRRNDCTGVERSYGISKEERAVRVSPAHSHYADFYKCQHMSVSPWEPLGALWAPGSTCASVSMPGGLTAPHGLTLVNRVHVYMSPKCKHIVWKFWPSCSVEL